MDSLPKEKTKKLVIYRGVFAFAKEIAPTSL